MKNLFLLLLAILTLNGCNKDDDNKPTNPVDQLPPATQTGANTAGCLVNGQVFLPYGNITGVNPLVYQDGLNFSLFIGEKKNNIIKSVGIFSRNQQLVVGTIYTLGENNDDGFSQYGIFSIDAIPPPSPNYYSTTLIIKGELLITHHDFDHAILSGTFWFDAINSNGEKIEIRNGRFDRHY